MPLLGIGLVAIGAVLYLFTAKHEAEAPPDSEQAGGDQEAPKGSDDE